MKPSWLLLTVAVVLAGVLSLVVLRPHLMVSPGALRPAHAALETRCSSCHLPFRGATSDRCIACHDVADIGRRTTRGAPIIPPSHRPPFHQALTSRDCFSCHVEHQGSNSARPAASFSHGLLNVSLQARCSTCHAAPADAVHRGQTANCAGCHSTVGWRPSTFDHARYFPLEGPHNVPCSTCHAGGDHSRYTCFSCHAHQPDRTRAQHEGEGVRYSANCVACHRSGRDEAGEGREGEGREGDD